MADSITIPAKFLIPILVESIELPSGLFWYELCGQTVFPIYGASGGITAGWAIILVERAPLSNFDLGLNHFVDDERGKWHSLFFYAYEKEDAIRSKIKEAIEAMTNGD